MDQIPLRIPTIQVDVFWEKGIASMNQDGGFGIFFHLHDLATLTIIEVGCDTFINTHGYARSIWSWQAINNNRVTSIAMLSAVFTTPLPWQQGQSW